METKTTNSERSPLRPFRPSLNFYHANQKGTGSALRMDLHPAHDYTDGCIMLRIANQLTIGDSQGSNRTFSTFDWENSICVKLDFSDLTQILQVFRGQTEAIRDGKGLYHSSVKGSTLIRFGHMTDPAVGYMLDISRKSNRENDNGTRARFMFNAAEALGVADAIAGSLSVICFGIPMLIPHDTAAYQAAVRSMRDASAG